MCLQGHGYLCETNTFTINMYHNFSKKYANLEKKCLLNV